MSGILFDRARSSPDPSWRTIGELVGDAAQRFADREFLRFPGASLSFAGAHAASSRLAHVLIAHGVRPGDRVAIMMGNGSGLAAELVRDREGRCGRGPGQCPLPGG